MITLEQIKKKSLPCPCCLGTKLKFIATLDYGHGEVSFNNGKIECQDCHTSKGNVSDYGTPTDKHETLAYLQWNHRFNCPPDENELKEQQMKEIMDYISKPKHNSSFKLFNKETQQRFKDTYGK